MVDESTLTGSRGVWTGREEVGRTDVVVESTADSTLLSCGGGMGADELRLLSRSVAWSGTRGAERSDVDAWGMVATPPRADALLARFLSCRLTARATESLRTSDPFSH